MPASVWSLAVWRRLHPATQPRPWQSPDPPPPSPRWISQSRIPHERDNFTLARRKGNGLVRPGITLFPASPGEWIVFPQSCNTEDFHTWLNGRRHRSGRECVQRVYVLPTHTPHVMSGRSVAHVREGNLLSITEPGLKRLTPRTKGASNRPLARLGRLAGMACSGRICFCTPGSGMARRSPRV